jgi:hypothetical protein
MAKLNVKDSSVNAVKARQDLFLKMYEKVGVISRTCNTIGLHMDTVMRWKKDDVLGFRDRFFGAHYIFAESLEELAYDRVQQQKPSDNPTLLIALLNANLPQKYRPQVGSSDEVTRDVMMEMRKTLKKMGDEEEVIEVEVNEKEQLDKLLESKKK